MLVIKCMSTVSSACVTISGVGKVTVVADMRATIPSTVVTKTCLSYSRGRYSRSICFTRLGM